MTRPNDLRPVEDLAATKPHGTRIRYMARCRCDLCRQANCEYEKARARARKAGDWNGYVDAERVRAHLQALRRQGLGRRAIAEATNIAESIVYDLTRGRQTVLRARTERKLLAVDASVRKDHALVSARPSRALVERLVDEGYTRTVLARRLGYRNDSLQFRDRITVRNAARIERLYRRLTS